MLSVYIAAAILGVGVTLFDIIGLIGGHSDATSHDGQDGDVQGSDSTGGDVHGSGAAHSDGPGDDTNETDTTGDDVSSAEGHGVLSPLVGRGERGVTSRTGGGRESFDLVSATVATMRNVVYFCIGFGVVGWYAIATGAAVPVSLLWSVPVGAVSLVGARLLRRLFRRELNSEIQESELLMERGTVIVSIGRGELGRVRIHLGDIYVERFARAEGNGRAIALGTEITVTNVSDECVFVEPVEASLIETRKEE